MDELEQFFGGYFHQDCFEDDPTWQAIVSRFKETATPAERAALARRVETELLDPELSERELGEKLYRLGSFYDPVADGLTHRQWLIGLVAQLRT